MRALVLWASPEHPNLGVAALAAGSESLLRRAFGADIDVRFHATGGPGQQGNDGPVNIGHAGPLLKKRLTAAGPIKDWLTSFDIILDTRAGDSFADIYTVKQLAKMSQIGMYARQWKVPVVMGPQTIGPFETARGRALARIALKSASVVMARDSQSAVAAKELGRPVDLVSTDVAFAIPVQKQTNKHDVLFNPSGLLWDANPHVDAPTYRRLVRQILEGLEAEGRRVSLLAHVAKERHFSFDNDVIPVEQLAASVSGDVVVPENLEEVRGAVSASRLVMGARMHACLNALSTGTPAVAMAYSRKFAPLLEQVGWHHTVDLRTGDATAEQFTAIARRQEQLDDEVLDVRRRADEFIDAAADALRKAL